MLSMLDKVLQAILKILKKKSEWVLVWSNASSTSAFKAQNIKLSLTGYDEVQIETRINKGTASDGGSSQMTFLRMGTGTYINAIHSLWDSGTAPGFATRNAWVNTAGVGFAGGYWHGGAASGGSSDNYIIPLNIWARKSSGGGQTS